MMMAEIHPTGKATMPTRFIPSVIRRWFASASFDLPPRPSMVQLRAIREAVEAYHDALEESSIPSESDSRYDGYFAARESLIEAIRALRPVEVPPELTGLDPIPWQSVRVDGRIYSILFDPYMDGWRLIVDRRPVEPIEA